ncbi:hypothetical protein [Corynebacterium sp. 335C]
MFASLRRPALAAGLAAVAVLPAACSDDAPEMTAMEVVPPEVRLVDAGGGDAAPVRWVDDGAEQDVVLSVTQGFNQKVAVGDESVSDAALPDTTMELPLQAQVTGGGAERAVDAELGEPTGSDHDLNDDIATAGGFRMEWTADDRGVISGMSLGAPDTSTETARAGVEASLRQWASLPVVFPEEAIGPGATWTVSHHVDDLGVDQEIVYELLGRDGDMVDLHVGVRQTPTVTELDGGDGVTLHAVHSQVVMTDASLRIDLRKPLPVSGKVSYVLSVGYSGEAGEDAEPAVVQEHLRALEFSEE